MAPVIVAEPVEPEPVSGHAPPLAAPRIMRQRWEDLTFLHWAVRPGTVARFMPPGVRVDVLDGWSYVGLVPFRMVGTGLPHGPALPWAGTFLETNVRLYSVDATGRRGVVFLNLDAERAAVVAVARTVFGVPYRWARMRYRADGDVRRYAAAVRWPGVTARSRVTVRAGAPLAAGPLEEFLTARWGLHVHHLGRTWFVPNAHPPWPLRAAEVLQLDDGLVASVGLGDLARRAPDHVAFSDGVPVEFGRPALATTPRAALTRTRSAR
jgi:uncharacterized protein